MPSIAKLPVEIKYTNHIDWYYIYQCPKKFEQKRQWCWKQDLNLRPIAYETIALPTELFQHIKDYKPYLKICKSFKSDLYEL